MIMDPAIAKLLESYFDKIFVVSIERATDRHAQVRQQLAGLSFEFFFGTDKQKMDWDGMKKSNAVYEDAKTRKYDGVGMGIWDGEIAGDL